VTPSKVRPHLRPDALLAELEAAAAGVGIKVSYEALQGGVGPGGLCRVKGSYRVILDKRTSVGERIAALGVVLGQLGTGDAPLSAPARELVARHTIRRAS
jgi:hypothetical protein